MDEETILLVDLYFRFIHDQPHSLFHKPSLRSSVLAGLVSKPVLYGILGNAARYATPIPGSLRSILFSSQGHDL